MKQEDKFCEFSDRMLTWFTPNMLASTPMILRRLEELAHEYDDKQEKDLLTVGDIDRIFAESDRLSAELWRRHITQKESPLS